MSVQEREISDRPESFFAVPRIETGHNYRPDIDGLRAIAVLSVVLYHAGVAGFTGGFVGVDIFFVISGYLITRLIAGEMERTRDFSFTNFYLRRIRRLFPALAVTLLATLAVGWFIFPPDLYKKTGESALAALLSFSNMYFWMGTGYFDDSSYLKPVLHTWSLSVEEQFYIIWPAAVVFLVLGLLQKIPSFIVAVVLTVVGLAATEHLARTAPSSAFFWMPARIFEFAIGAALVWLPTKLRPEGWRAELSFAIGLALIAYSIVMYREGSPLFPGISALAPCIGAALIIASPQSRLSQLTITGKPVVFIGLISYSLYLVHWPIIVFYTQWVGRSLFAADKALIVALSIVLGVLLYYLVETPFRKRQFKWGIERELYVALVLSNFAVGAGVVASDGVITRFAPELAQALSPQLIKESQDFTWQTFRELNKPFTPDQRRKVLIIGDSQGADFTNMVVASPLAQNVDVATFPSWRECQVLFDVAYYKSARRRGACLGLRTKLLAEKRIGQADAVVLAFAWGAGSLKYLNQSITELKKLGAKRIYVVGRKDQGLSGPDIAFKLRTMAGADEFSASRRSVDALRVNKALVETTKAANVSFVDLMKVFCPTRERCLVYSPTGLPIFFDFRHISKGAISHAASLISQNAEVQEMLAGNGPTRSSSAGGPD